MVSGEDAFVDVSREAMQANKPQAASQEDKIQKMHSSCVDDYAGETKKRSRDGCASEEDGSGGLEDWRTGAFEVTMRWSAGSGRTLESIDSGIRTGTGTGALM